jgi:hypothetical protein
MSQFQDADFLVWEAYASGGDHGFADDEAHVIFHCLTDRSRRSRIYRTGGTQADAERLVHEATPDELRELLRNAPELP